MKVLIYGDPHVNKYPQGLTDQRRSTELDLFKYIYEVLVKEYNIDMCICLGDFLHNSYIAASDMKYLSDIISTITTRTEILTGNHERSDEENSAITWFSMLNSNIHVITKYDKYVDDHDKVHVFVSYGHMKDLDKELLASANYLYTHEDYSGLVLNTSGSKSVHGYKFSKSDVKDTLRVFNGHIHHKDWNILSMSDQPEILNVGAVSPVAFGELELYDYPGVVILDTENGSSSYAPVKQPILPVTCSVGQYGEVLSKYNDELSHVRLRVTYRGDLPELDHTDRFLSVEYKKLLESSLDDTQSVTQVEDVIVSVPNFIQEYLSGTKDISEDEKPEVLSICQQILDKSVR